MLISQTKRAYLAGFLDGDGSIYVQLKPNKTYKFGFQIAPYIVLFQSQKDQKNFEQLCSMINLGYMRIRKDGILEYIIGKQENITKFINLVEPYVIMKKLQAWFIMRKGMPITKHLYLPNIIPLINIFIVLTSKGKTLILIIA